jgi:SAM-dependent methyltransferase
MTSALAVYGGALRDCGTGLSLLDTAGRSLRQLDTAVWHQLRGGDDGVLDRCDGPTLDVGCGPGRMVAALHSNGVPALGIDISPTAVRLTLGRGAPAVSADVFGTVPGEGRWRHILLVDGNIGIGGDPVRLLRRCARLLSPNGTALVEADPPGVAGWAGEAVLHDGRRASAPFRWALVGTDELHRHATAAGLRVLESWTQADRWFTCLAH